MNTVHCDHPRRRSARLLVRLSNAYRRFLAVFLALLGPQAAYAIFAALARGVYRLLDPLRLRSEAQCRAALAGRYPDEQISRIAEQAFVHRAWNLADLMLADRRLHAGTYDRYGGRIPEPYGSMLRDAQCRRQPVLLVTGYYGPFDLLPLLLGFNGIRAAAVYRAHPNPDFDAYRRAIRSRSGCEMVPDTQAAVRLPQVLESGGTVAILADHHAPGRGIPITYLGLPTAVARTVGLLAWRYAAVVAVAALRRRRRPFQFEIVIADLFDSSAWHNEPEPVVYITRRYTQALERIVLEEPAQYLWAHARWGPAVAQRLTDEPRPAGPPYVTIRDSTARYPNPAR